MLSEYLEDALGLDWILLDDLQKAGILFFSAGCASTYQLPLGGEFWKEFIEHIEEKIDRAAASESLVAAFHTYQIASRPATTTTVSDLSRAVVGLTKNPDWRSGLELFGICSDGILNFSDTQRIPV